MYRRTFAILISVLALAGVAAGCGDDESSADSLSKAEFVEQGDAVCKKANQKGNQQLLDFLQDQGNAQKPLTESQEEELITTVIVPLVKKQVSTLKGLGTPDESGEEAEALIAELESVQRELEEDPVKAASSGEPFAESEKMAKELGFKHCGHN